MNFSIIIPVYNRPDEIKELLDSLVLSTYSNFEIIIVEDGSTIDCKRVVLEYSKKLNIGYYFKTNSGPGDSRNFGMKKASGDYFIIFDSDCIIPNDYLAMVDKQLEFNYVDCYGGPDKALKSFSNIQKAINFAMTSVLTTGGIRGGSEVIDTFQPRSFNMGISKKAFEASNGFGNIHPGEDPDLSIRLWKLGFKTKLFSNCFVYHKRRIDWEKFSNQVTKFGKVRPILNYWHPKYKKLTYWFPSLFVIGFFVSVIALILLYDWPLKIYFFYFVLIFIVSSIQNRNPIIGLLSVKAVWKQFMGYGLGFLNSFFKINVLGKKPEVTFPELFFNSVENSKADNEIIETKKEVAVLPIVEKDEIIETQQINKKEEVPTSIIIEKPVVVVKTKIIGLTGGIGSGKTTVANYMKSLGIPVYISDLEAKKVMDLPVVMNKIIATFGDSILSNNILDREKLATVVFTHSNKLKLLNSIVHPAVKMHFENWKKQHQNYPIIVKETAILIESGSYKDCDEIISVIAPLETRIDRVLKRDTTTREKVLARIKNQISDKERQEKSNYTINNSTIEETKNQVDEILKILKNK